MGVTALSFSAVVNVPSGRLLGNNGVSTGPAVALTSTQVFAVLATGTPSATTYLRGDGTWATVSTGVGGSTGSTDNAVLRADGTGGATLQDSAFVIPDNATASPNATVNHASIQATGGTTNVSVSIVPKGTGSLSLQVPDGTSAGGNARGASAVDLQLVRSAATQVASGTQSGIFGGRNNTCAATQSVVIGCRDVNLSVGTESVVAGTSDSTFAFGADCVVLGGYAHSSDAVNNSAIIGGQYARMRLSNAVFLANGRWAANGDRQSIRLTGSAKTTTNAAVEFDFGLGNGNIPVYITVPAGFVVTVQLLIQGSKSDGSVVARYCRHATIRRVGNTMTLVSSDTVGTDIVNGTSLSITADGTNFRFAIAPTGVLNETWRWNCLAEVIEQAYGT